MPKTRRGGNPLACSGMYCYLPQWSTSFLTWIIFISGWLWYFYEKFNILAGVHTWIVDVFKSNTFFSTIYNVSIQQAITLVQYPQINHYFKKLQTSFGLVMLDFIFLYDDLHRYSEDEMDRDCAIEVFLNLAEYAVLHTKYYATSKSAPTTSVNINGTMFYSNTEEAISNKVYAGLIGNFQRFLKKSGNQHKSTYYSIMEKLFNICFPRETPPPLVIINTLKWICHCSQTSEKYFYGYGTFNQLLAHIHNIRYLLLLPRTHVHSLPAKEYSEFFGIPESEYESIPGIAPGATIKRSDLYVLIRELIESSDFSIQEAAYGVPNLSSIIFSISNQLSKNVEALPQLMIKIIHKQKPLEVSYKPEITSSFISLVTSVIALAKCAHYLPSGMFKQQQHRVFLNAVSVLPRMSFFADLVFKQKNKLPVSGGKPQPKPMSRPTNQPSPKTMSRSRPTNQPSLRTRIWPNKTRSRNKHSTLKFPRNRLKQSESTGNIQPSEPPENVLPTLAGINSFNMAIDLCIETENKVWDILLTKLNDDLISILNGVPIDAQLTDAILANCYSLLKTPVNFVNTQQITGQELLNQIELLNASDSSKQYGGDPVSLLAMFVTGSGAVALAILGTYQMLEEQITTMRYNYAIVASIYNEQSIYVYLFDLSTLKYKDYLSFPQLAQNLYRLENSLLQMFVCVFCLHDETNSLLNICLDLALHAIERTRAYLREQKLSEHCIEGDTQHTSGSAQCVAEAVYNELPSKLNELIIKNKRNTDGTDSPFYVFMIRLQNSLFTPEPRPNVKSLLQWLTYSNTSLLFVSFQTFEGHIKQMKASLDAKEGGLNLTNLMLFFNEHLETHQFNFAVDKSYFGSPTALLFSVIKQIVTTIEGAEKNERLIKERGLDKTKLSNFITSFSYLATHVHVLPASFTETSLRTLDSTGKAIGMVTRAPGKALGMLAKAPSKALQFFGLTQAEGATEGGGVSDSINLAVHDLFIQLYLINLQQNSTQLSSYVDQVKQNFKNLIAKLPYQTKQLIQTQQEPVNLPEPAAAEEPAAEEPAAEEPAAEEKWHDAE